MIAATDVRICSVFLRQWCEAEHGRHAEDGAGGRAGDRDPVHDVEHLADPAADGGAARLVAVAAACHCASGLSVAIWCRTGGGLDLVVARTGSRAARTRDLASDPGTGASSLRASVTVRTVRWSSCGWITPSRAHRAGDGIKEFVAFQRLAQAHTAVPGSAFSTAGRSSAVMSTTGMARLSTCRRRISWKPSKREAARRGPGSKR
jgi:hypothetical protein